jgi:hypothetical protein
VLQDRGLLFCSSGGVVKDRVLQTRRNVLMQFGARRLCFVAKPLIRLTDS